MPSSLTLLTIPDVPLKHILERCDYLSILSLRKSCWSLRNFIDDTNLDIFIEELQLSFRFTNYELSATFLSNQETKLVYSEGCKITKGDKEYVVKNQNFQDVFWRDLGLFAKQCSIRNLRVSVDDDVTLSSLPRMKTEAIKLAWSQQNLMDILPHLDEKSIKTIYVNFLLWRSQIEIDEVVKLQQWKNAEELFFLYDVSVIDPKVEHFAHFSHVSVTFEKFDLENVKEIIKTFSDNPKMNCFNLRFRGIHDFNRPRIDAIKKVLIDQFEQLTVIPRSESYSKYIWTFTIQNSEILLKMSLVGGAVAFTRFKKKVEDPICKLLAREQTYFLKLSKHS